MIELMLIATLARLFGKDSTVDAVMELMDMLQWPKINRRLVNVYCNCISYHTQAITILNIFIMHLYPEIRDSPEIMAFIADGLKVTQLLMFCF